MQSQQYASSFPHSQSLLSFQLPLMKVLTCLDLKLLTFQMLSLLASEAGISPSFYTLWSHQMSQNGPGSGPPGLHVWHPVLWNNSIPSDFMQTESIKQVTLEQITIRYLKKCVLGTVLTSPWVIYIIHGSWRTLTNNKLCFGFLVSHSIVIFVPVTPVCKPEVPL